MAALAAAPDAPAPAAPTAAQVREAVVKSLPAVEKSGVRWIEQRKCLSCHSGAFTLWGHTAARDAGIAIDDKKLDKWNDWSLNHAKSLQSRFKLTPDAINALRFDGLTEEVLMQIRSLLNKAFSTEQEYQQALTQRLPDETLQRYETSLLKRGLLAVPGGLDQDTAAQLLLGRGYKQDSAIVAAIPELTARILLQQRADGSWSAGGQLRDQRRPRAEGEAVATMWAVLGLATIEKPNDDVIKARDKALAFLKNVKPGESNESVLLLMLVEKQFGQAEKAEELLAELRKRRNADGGWAWRHGEKSDAFGTGQAIWALVQMGRDSTDPAIQHGTRFLLDSQLKDGSWNVPFQTISGKKRQEGGVLQEVYDHWGTTWATIGLARTLPR